MWGAIKVGAAVLGTVALTMGGLAVTGAAAQPDEEGPVGAVMRELQPLVEDGTLSEAQAEAVADRLGRWIRIRLFREGTEELRRHLTRLAAEVAEILAIPPSELAAQLEDGATLAELAEAGGSSGGRLISDVVDHLSAHLAVAVTSGRLEQSAADRMLASVEETLVSIVDVEHPFRRVIDQRRERAARLEGLAAAAEVMGMSVGDVRAELAEGISLAEVAEGRGVEADRLIEAILTPFREHLERAVARGRLTEERAAELLSGAAERVTEAIERVPGG